MDLIVDIKSCREFVGKQQAKGKCVGFVPTMGALHDGHLQLVRRSKEENDFVVVSVFVNPTQFNNKEDLQKYPRTLDEDLKLLKEVGCDLVFVPNAEEFYSVDELNSTFEYDFEGLDLVMEGKFRPGHFNGVVQVVKRLFEIVNPNKSYFGEKDFQQLAVIRQMTRKFKFDIDIVPCPIVRADSGLALSSRNARLTDGARDLAKNIYRILKESSAMVKPLLETKQWVVDSINEYKEFEVEYFEIVDGNTLQSLENWTDSGYIVGCITVYCEGVRLIDNIVYTSNAV